MNFEQITMSDDEGRFPFRTLNPGAYQITAEAPNFSPVTRDIPVSSRLTVENIHFRSVSSVQKISVVEPTSDALTPDPKRTYVPPFQLLEANPCRPGAPVSISGLPIETASGGIKASQLFCARGHRRSWRAHHAVPPDREFIFPE